MTDKYHNRWTDAETDLARRMIRENYKEEAFQQALGRSKKAAQARVRQVDFPRDRSMRTDRNGLYVNSSVRKIPDEVIAERDRRRSAARTITAFVLGDPAPGQSALDKREARL